MAFVGMEVAAPCGPAAIPPLPAPIVRTTRITKIDVHQQTDEVFVLLKGTAVLIAASESGDLLNFECVNMEQGITYNIPVNTWHNIAMSRDAAVIIVERNDTHLGDFVFRQLTLAEQDELREKIRNSLYTSK